MTREPIQINNEIGTLKTILLKRPGRELENLVPDHLSGLLFDDILYSKVTQEEHDQFAETLGSEGIEVVYLRQFAAEAIENEDVRQQFIDDILSEFQKTILDHEKETKDYFSKLSSQALIEKIMAGIRKEEIQPETTRLAGYLDDRYPFHLDPIPNLYFTRDP